ncbi:helix-turn-helix transcriptional regulator [Hydrocarboniphaga effusa]|uniref:helix-turn-helix transcriptional regulator n=1 Tax=Hydrocarboniphaga effusa TaxID=243629 RepID=UPI00398C009D
MQLLTCADVRSRTTLSKSRIYQLMAQGDFPRPVRLGTLSVAWVADEIDAWIRRRIEARGSVSPPN